LAVRLGTLRRAARRDHRGGALRRIGAGTRGDGAVRVQRGARRRDGEGGSRPVTGVGVRGTNVLLALRQAARDYSRNDAPRWPMTPKQTSTLAPTRHPAAKRRLPDGIVPEQARQRPQRFGVVHLAWEYLPLARTGGSGDEGSDYPDNARRFALFARAALAVLPRIAPSARILHAHDWHTALAPVYLRTAHAGEPYYDRLGTVLSVHNAGFQGHFPPDTVTDLGLAAELYDWRALEWFGRMNVLKGGLAFSDVVVTVSPSHARELQT